MSFSGWEEEAQLYGLNYYLTEQQSDTVSEICDFPKMKKHRDKLVEEYLKLQICIEDY